MLQFYLLCGRGLQCCNSIYYGEEAYSVTIPYIIWDRITHRRRMEIESKAKCRCFGMGGKIECRTGDFGVIL